MKKSEKKYVLFVWIEISPFLFLFLTQFLSFLFINPKTKSKNNYPSALC